MTNTKKTTLLKSAFCTGIGLLATLVATYSYVGEKPLSNAIKAMCVMLGSVILSGLNVMFVQRRSYKSWTAYCTSAASLLVAAVAAYSLWDYIPHTVEARWWFNVSVSIAFASLLVTLFTAHFVFENHEVEVEVRKALPEFRFVSDSTVMSTGRWAHDLDLLLEYSPQRQTIQAFVGAGTDIVVLMSAMMAALVKQGLFSILHFDPDRETQRLKSGKLIRSCIAAASAGIKVKFDFILDPEKNEGIVIQSPA
jgi:hypothetical protein